MRVWLDPEKLAARSMTPGDVVAALRLFEIAERPDSMAATAVVDSPPAVDPDHDDSTAAMRRRAMST